jgi:addiction module RelE/StbE family toxin
LEYQVILTPRAQRDLKSIRAYIARDNQAAAANFCRNLLSKALSLTTFPKRGQRVAGDDARTIVHESYIIFYDIDFLRGRVEILRFRHGARDQERMRLKEEGALYSAPLAQAATA